VTADSQEVENRVAAGVRHGCLPPISAGTHRALLDVRHNVERHELEHKREVAVDEHRSVPDGSFRREERGLGTAWRSFVPDYVVRTLLRNPNRTPIADSDCSDAVVLFIDVAGFTPLSEALTNSGAYGTEELTRILNGWFDTMVSLVSLYGGAVAEFAGDALTAVFWCDANTRQETERRAVGCALYMQAEMARFQAINTRAGTFELAMKAGLAAGPLLVTIMGDPAIRLGYVLAGPALDRAARAEQHARRGEVVVDHRLLEAGLNAELLEHRGLWSVVERLRGSISPVRPAPLDSVDEGTARRLAPFLHPAIAERLRSGRREFVNEHRKVTVAFVGVPELATDDLRSVAALQRFLAVAVRVIDGYGGHLLQVATGDKGSLLVACFGAPLLPGAAAAAGWAVPGRCHHRVRLLWRGWLELTARVRGDRRFGQPRLAHDAGRRAGAASHRPPDP
jgi:class 3 adenylate cyclase